MYIERTVKAVFFFPVYSVQCWAGPYSSSISHFSLHPLLSPLFQVQHSRSIWQKRCDWEGSDVEVEGTAEGDEEEGAWVVLEARRDG